MPLSKITHEANSKRKAYRINIPIHILIQNKKFLVKDWSVNGLRIIAPKPEDLELKEGDVQEASLLLPTGDSSIILDIKFCVRNMMEHFYGVEIVEISDKNKKVLRHYATLALEGKIDNIDDLSTNLFMTNVASPIAEPISLSENEDKELKKSFIKRFSLFFVFFILAFLFALVTLLYNYIIIEQTTGITAGNAMQYRAPFDGKVGKIYVHLNQKITKGELLFNMDTTGTKNNLNLLQATQANLKKSIEQIQLEYQNLQKDAQHIHALMRRSSNKQKTLLLSQYNTEIKKYKKAQQLYNQQLISFKDFTLIQTQYLLFINRYNSIVKKDSPTDQDTLLLQQTYIKTQDQLLTLKKSLNTLSMELQDNILKVQTLKNTLRQAHVYARTQAKVYAIDAQEGENLKFGQKVLLTQIHKRPFIVTKILKSNLENISQGGLVIIYSATTHKRYRGYINAIGSTALDEDSLNMENISQQEVPVKIELADKDIYFNLNDYLSIYFVNNTAFSQYLTDKFLDK